MTPRCPPPSHAAGQPQTSARVPATRCWSLRATTQASRAARGVAASPKTSVVGARRPHGHTDNTCDAHQALPSRCTCARRRGRTRFQRAHTWTSPTCASHQPNKLRRGVKGYKLRCIGNIMRAQHSAAIPRQAPAAEPPANRGGRVGLQRGLAGRKTTPCIMRGVPIRFISIGPPGTRTKRRKEKRRGGSPSNKKMDNETRHMILGKVRPHSVAPIRLKVALPLPAESALLRPCTGIPARAMSAHLCRTCAASKANPPLQKTRSRKR